MSSKGTTFKILRIPAKWFKYTRAQYQSFILAIPGRNDEYDQNISWNI